MSRLVIDTMAPGSVEPAEAVHVDTVDDFCSRQSIEKIGLLKVDTEGHDLAVLEGARQMLQQQKVDLVEVEAGMNPGNSLHCRFEDLKGALEGRGYLLFAIYEQVEEWPTLEPHLRRCNPVFISARMTKLYKRAH